MPTLRPWVPRLYTPCGRFDRTVLVSVQSFVRHPIPLQNRTMAWWRHELVHVDSLQEQRRNKDVLGIG